MVKSNNRGSSVGHLWERGPRSVFYAKGTGKILIDIEFLDLTRFVVPIKGLPHYGAAGFFCKPFDMKSLLDKVAQLI